MVIALLLFAVVMSLIKEFTEKALGQNGADEPINEKESTEPTVVRKPE